MIRLDTIVGTAERRRDFDRRFRPTSHRVRFRWERQIEAYVTQVLAALPCGMVTPTI